jgi:hypothetical protein
MDWTPILTCREKECRSRAYNVEDWTAGSESGEARLPRG